MGHHVEHGGSSRRRRAQHLIERQLEERQLEERQRLQREIKQARRVHLHEVTRLHRQMAGYRTLLQPDGSGPAYNGPVPQQRRNRRLISGP